MGTVKKNVSFADDDAPNIIYEYERPQSPPTDAECVRESAERSSLEKSIIERPYTHLERMHSLIASWRTRDISVVFGNLGRQPFLLNYYLEICFGNEDRIKIVCESQLSSDYQTQDDTDADFLILVEPYFGFSIQKHPTVKHLVILTSHLSLHYWGTDTIEYDYLYLTDSAIPNLHDPHLQDCTPFKPPVFHLQVQKDVLPETVLLDVSGSKTAREAYLRVLTGRDIIQNKPFKIQMDERDQVIIKVALRITREKWLELFKAQGDNCSMGYFLYKYLNMT